MPIYKVPMFRSVTSTDELTRYIDAPDQATAANYARTLAYGYNHSCPDDTTNTDVECADWQVDTDGLVDYVPSVGFTLDPDDVLSAYPADISIVTGATALVRDALNLLDNVEDVEDIAMDDGVLKVIVSGTCFAVRVEILS